MNVCIFGAGPGAMAMACRVREAGHQAALCELSRFPENIEIMRETQTIHAKGMISGRFDLGLVTIEAEKALAWADMVLVVTHAAAHREIAELCARHLSEPKAIILCPAYVGGGWRFHGRIKELRPSSPWSILECSVLPFACRKTDGDRVSVGGIKRRFFVAPSGEGDSGPALRLIDELFTGAQTRDHAFEAGLHETNFIPHTCIALLNFGLVQGGKPWTFYRQGLSEGIGRMIEAVDAERAALLEKLQLTPVPLTEWFLDFYGDQGLKGDTFYEMLSTFAPFAESPGPLSLDHRYFSEDVAYGLVPMAGLADAAGVNVPLTESLIQLAEVLCRHNYREHGGDLKGIVIE